MEGEQMDDIGKIGDKALVKKTGEESKIKKSWGIKTINVKEDFIVETGFLNGEVCTFTKVFNTENLDLPPGVSGENLIDNWFYELDNGDKVTKDDVVTGVEDIREYKISNIIVTKTK
jgi:hypothetical protein